MPKSTNMLNSFTSGELSPRAKGRTDLAKYGSGAAKMENFLINQLGGAMYRPGTRYVASTKSNGVARIFPFQYSEDQDYVVEAGDIYFRLYSNGADIISQTVNLTKLLVSGNHTVDGSLEFLDDGNTGHIVSALGTAQTSTAVKKFGSTSLLVDGDSDYLTVPDHADLRFGAANFTVDYYASFSGPDAAVERAIGTYTAAAGGSYWIAKKEGTGSGNKLSFLAVIGGVTKASYIMTNNWAVTTGQLYHIAWVRNGAVMLLFIDGVAQTITETIAIGANNIDVAGDYQIGRLVDEYMYGYLDEIRVSDTARWTTGFTPSTTAYTSDANTLLLLHCETQDQSTTKHRIQFMVTAQLDTAVKKFDDSSLLLDGDSDYLKIPDNAVFDVVGSPDDNWTIGLWADFADHVGTETLIAQYEDANNQWRLEHVHGSGLRFIVISGGNTIITTGYGGEIADLNFHHIAVCKVGTKYGVYNDGTQVCYVDDASTDTFAGDVYVGATGAPGDYFQGNLEDIRIIQSNVFTAAPNITNTDTIVIPTSAHTAAPSSQTELITPYLEADLFDLQMAQYNDVMYIVHPDYAPRKLSRTGASAFSLSLVGFVRPPLMDTNTEATTITPSADAGAAITLTASVATFDILHVGGFFRVKSGVVKITGHTSALIVTGDVQAEPDGTAGGLATGPAATTDWAEGAFSDYRGWPSAIAFHEQRLYYANTATEPQKFWGSYIAAYDSFDQTATTDAFAVTVQVATEQRNAIRWMSSGNRALSLGTTGGTFSASSSNTAEAIAPDNVVVNRDTNYGVAALLPQRISSFLYYIQRDFSKLRELSYSFQVDSTVSSDMTLLADHILKDGTTIVDIAHQQSPNDRIFCLRDDGTMAVLTRNPEQEVMGWCRFTAGEDAQGAGTYESVCVIPKTQEQDQVWVVVKRNINGTDKRFLEYFVTEDFDENWDAIRCDSSLTLDTPDTITGVTIASDLILYTAGSVALANGDQIKINGVVGTTDINGTFLVDTLTLGVSFKITTLLGVAIDFSTYDAWISGGEIRKMVTAIANLDHLVGETVSVQTDGYIPTTETYVVQAGGTITLSEKAAVVHAGLPYDGTLQLLKLSDGSPTGTGQTRTRRIFKGTLRLDRSLGLAIGRTSTAADDLQYDEDVLFTGDKKKVFQTTWDDEDEIVITQTRPLPANILAVVLRSETSEG